MRSRTCVLLKGGGAGMQGARFPEQSDHPMFVDCELDALHAEFAGVLAALVYFKITVPGGNIDTPTGLLLAFCYMYYVAKIRRTIVARDKIRDVPTYHNKENKQCCNEGQCEQEHGPGCFGWKSIDCENYWCVLDLRTRATPTRPRRRCWCCVALWMFRHDLLKRDPGREYSDLCSPTGLPGPRGASVHVV